MLRTWLGLGFEDLTKKLDRDFGDSANELGGHQDRPAVGKGGRAELGGLGVLKIVRAVSVANQRTVRTRIYRDSRNPAMDREPLG